jgi:hypothetical protein
VARGEFSRTETKGRSVIAREGALRRSRDPLSYAIGVILIHLAVVLVHGLTHSRLGIGLNAAQERDFRRGGDYGCAARGQSSESWEKLIWRNSTPWKSRN